MDKDKKDGVKETPEVAAEHKAEEVGGLKDKPEPTRYGDWELNGKCVDF